MLSLRNLAGLLFGVLMVVGSPLFEVLAQELSDSEYRVYSNKLTKIEHPQPLLADYPQFFEPIIELRHFEAPALVQDEDPDLFVRAWRFSYNARGIIEIPNFLKAAHTAVMMVHPWGIDDGQGWDTPEPAGVADFCTPDKNALAAEHTRTVIRPFLNRLRGQVSHVLFSLPGNRDSIRSKLYRSIVHNPSDAEREQGAAELSARLRHFEYRGQPIIDQMRVSTVTPFIDYFREFPGLDSGPLYNNQGFWDLPIPVTRDVDMSPNDVVIYDAEGYPPLRDFLKAEGIHHILLTGYATDMCFARTTAGYENLSRDFNVFLVGDASLATFPANSTPRFAVNAAISFASLNQMITQISWVQSAPSPSP